MAGGGGAKWVAEVPLRCLLRHIVQRVAQRVAAVKARKQPRAVPASTAGGCRSFLPFPLSSSPSCSERSGARGRGRKGGGSPSVGLVVPHAALKGWGDFHQRREGLVGEAQLHVAVDDEHIGIARGGGVF